MKKREEPEDGAWIREFREKYPEEVKMGSDKDWYPYDPETTAGRWLGMKYEAKKKDDTGIVRAGKSWEDAELVREFEENHPYLYANSGVEDEMAGRIRKSVPKVKEETMSDRKNHEIEEREDEESRVYGEKLPDANETATEASVKKGGCATGDHEPAESPIPYKSVKMCAKCRCLYSPKSE